MNLYQLLGFLLFIYDKQINNKETIKRKLHPFHFRCSVLIHILS